MKYFSFNSGTKKWQSVTVPSFTGNIIADTVVATSITATTVTATTVSGTTASFTATGTFNALVSTSVTATTVNATAIAASSYINANTGGADGGPVLRSWTGTSSYTGLATANMIGSEYMIISDGTDTFVSGGASGTSTIRGGINSSTAQIAVSTTAVDVTGTMNIGGYKAVRDLTNNGGQIQHGVVSSSAAIAAGGSMFIPYTFPVSFTGTPNVTMSYNTGTGGSVYVVTRVLAITSSGANFYFYNATTTAGVTITHQAQWIGIY